MRRILITNYKSSLNCINQPHTAHLIFWITTKNYRRGHSGMENTFIYMECIKVMQEKGDRNFAGITLFVYVTRIHCRWIRRHFKCTRKQWGSGKVCLAPQIDGTRRRKGWSWNTNNCTQAIYYSSLFVKLSISSLSLCRPFSLLRKN
jgi:hypothetical protein